MIKLYAKQRRLIHLVTDQIYEKEKNNRNDDRDSQSDCRVPKW